MASIPPKFNYSRTGEAIHKLSILSYLKGISPPKQDVKSNPILKGKYEIHLSGENET